MPSPKLDFLSHINLCWLLLRGCVCIGLLLDDFLAFVSPIIAYVFTAFVHKLDIDLAVGLIFYIDHVHIAVVATSQYH
jgi:hypothetical protein